MTGSRGAAGRKLDVALSAKVGRLGAV